MQIRELDTVPAGRYAYFAAQDARVKSYAAGTHYSAAQKLVAQRKKLLLELAYASTVYINYRAKFVALKVANPEVQNSTLLKQIEEDFAAEGIVAAVTPQGIVYRIPKK